MLGQKYKNSDKLVAPYIVCVSSYITFILTPPVHDVNFSWLCDNAPFIWYFLFMQRHIFEDNLGSQRVRRFFSLDAEERLDNKEVVNLTRLCFELLQCFSLNFLIDSLL